MGVASWRCGFWILKDMVHYWYILAESDINLFYAELVMYLASIF